MVYIVVILAAVLTLMVIIDMDNSKIKIPVAIVLFLVISAVGLGMNDTVGNTRNPNYLRYNTSYHVFSMLNSGDKDCYIILIGEGDESIGKEDIIGNVFQKLKKYVAISIPKKDLTVITRNDLKVGSIIFVKTEYTQKLELILPEKMIINDQ